MNGLHEAEKLRRNTLMHLGNSLGDYYGRVLQEAMPDRLTDLLRRLAASSDCGSSDPNDMQPVSGNLNMPRDVEGR